MTLDMKKENDKSIISFSDCDRIDTTNLKIIKEQLNPIILDVNNNTQKEFVFDFDNINFIDSSGLSMIINIYKKLSQNDNTLHVINANELINDIFDITKLNTFVSVSTRA